jgi:polyhydroxyalkanoate synthesis repressor PhaR
MSRPQEKDEVVIKKYANRRLYDTTHSRYVNLEDVARLVREGRSVRVVDAASGDDLTRVVLTQIILEDARSEEGGLPLELLRRLVAASDESMQQFLDWYLDTALEGYRKASDAFREHLDRVGGTGAGPFEAMQRAFDPRRMVDWMGGRSDRGEVDELRRRIAELEQRLTSIADEEEAR